MYTNKTPALLVFSPQYTSQHGRKDLSLFYCDFFVYFLTFCNILWNVLFLLQPFFLNNILLFYGILSLHRIWRQHKAALKEYCGSSTSQAQSTKNNFHLSPLFFKNSKNLGIYKRSEWVKSINIIMLAVSVVPQNINTMYMLTCF